MAAAIPLRTYREVRIWLTPSRDENPCERRDFELLAPEAEGVSREMGRTLPESIPGS
jgi:hypothetical protein